MAYARRKTYKRKRARVFKRRVIRKRRTYRRKVKRSRKRIVRRLKTNNNYIVYKLRQSAGQISLSGSGTSTAINWSNGTTAPTTSNYSFAADPTTNSDSFFANLISMYQQFRVRKVVFKLIPRFNPRDLAKYEAYGNPMKMVMFPQDPAKPGQTYGYTLYERAMQQTGAKSYPLGKAIYKSIKPTICDLKQMYAWNAVPSLTNNYNRFITAKYPWIDYTIFTGESKTGVPPTAPVNLWFPGLNQDQETCQTTCLQVGAPGGATMANATMISNVRNTNSQAGFKSDPDALEWDVEYDITCEFRRSINSNS